MSLFRRLRASVLALLVAAAALPACRRAAEAPSAKTAETAAPRPSAPWPKNLDVVLVTIDTLRADAVGFARQPARRDADARQARLPGRRLRRGARAERRHAAVAHQHPDRALPVPARRPGQQRVQARSVGADDRHAPARPRLRDRRVRRRLSARLALRPDPRIRRLRRPVSPREVDPGFRDGRAARARRSSRRAREWWEKQAGRPRFLWMHLYDCHAPYRPPAPFAERYADDPYLGEVAGVDAALAPFLGPFLSGAAGPALVIVTSDHGEARGDHGEETHGLFTYEATLHIPLVVWCRGVLPPGRSSEYVRHVDIAPTILAALGAEKPAAWPGASLFPRGRRRASASLLFRVVLDRLQPRLGAAARHARGRREVHRSADPRALRPAAGRRGGEQSRVEEGRRAAAARAPRAGGIGLPFRGPGGPGFRGGPAASEPRLSRGQRGPEGQVHRGGRPQDAHRRRPAHARLRGPLPAREASRGDRRGARRRARSARDADGLREPGVRPAPRGRDRRGARRLPQGRGYRDRRGGARAPVRAGALRVGTRAGGAPAARAALREHRPGHPERARHRAIRRGTGRRGREDVPARALDRPEEHRGLREPRHRAAPGRGLARGARLLREGALVRRAGRAGLERPRRRAASARAGARGHRRLEEGRGVRSADSYDALFNLGLVAGKNGLRKESREALERFVAEAPPGQYGPDIAKARNMLRELREAGT